MTKSYFNFMACFFKIKSKNKIIIIIISLQYINIFFKDIISIFNGTKTSTQIKIFIINIKNMLSKIF